MGRHSNLALDVNGKNREEEIGIGLKLIEKIQNFAHMQSFIDIHHRSIRLTEERQLHLRAAHPEMTDYIPRIAETLSAPDKVV